MKKLNFVLFLIFIATVSTLAQPPDTLWTKTFGGSLYDEGRSVKQTADGGFIVAGKTSSFGSGGSDIYLIKTGATGNTQWTQTLGFNLNDEGHDVQQTSDGGYIIVGYTNSIGAGDYDVLLYKTDSSGNPQWYQSYGGGSEDYGYSVQQTTDGGYIIAGWTRSFNGFLNEDVYLIKTNALGNEQWHNIFFNFDRDKGYCVQQTSDGGYIIVGETASYPNGVQDVLLLKTDASGNQQWNRSFGGDNLDICYCVQQTNDNGYIIAGNTMSYGAGNSDVYLIKTNPSGNEQWNQTFGGYSIDEGRSVRQTSDGGYIISGHSFSYGAGQMDVYLIKTYASGYEHWSQTFGGTSSDQSYSVEQTEDNGYIVTGTTWTFGAGASDIWLLRVVPESIFEVTVSLSPYNPPIQIPMSGGTFDFNIEFENGESIHPITIDIWTMVTLPNGSEYGPIIYVPDFNAPAGFIGDRDRTQSVPTSAPSGMYTYDGYVGVYPDTIWAEDHFDFEKLETDNSSVYDN